MTWKDPTVFMLRYPLGQRLPVWLEQASLIPLYIRKTPSRFSRAIFVFTTCSSTTQKIISTAYRQDDRTGPTEHPPPTSELKTVITLTTTFSFLFTILLGLAWPDLI
jgi:hypothetical protein